MLQAALHYEKMGYSVIPLKSGSKEPMIKWFDYQKRRATPEEIRKWWLSNPQSNIGLVTGSVTQLAVVDLDGPIGIKSGSSIALASTVVVQTGNGKQYYYRDTGGVCRNEVKKHYDGVDLRGAGGYCVAPPSIHPNGRRYVSLTPVVGVKDLTPFPAHLFAPSATTEANSITTFKSKEESWIAKALEEMTNGNIDDTLFKVCARLRNDGYSETDARILLQPHADRVGATSGHLSDKIRNVWDRYQPKAPIQFRNDKQGGLTIHSPTNRDSIEQFRVCQMDTDRINEYPTGYEKFDELTGGLIRGEILTVAARTGVGKTNWLIGPIRTLCESDKKVLLFSTEMSFDQIWRRYRTTLKNPTDFERHKFYVCDEFAPNTERVEEALKQILPDVFIFDHINNVGEEHHQLSEFMKGLKFLARKFNIPCIMTAQLNRTADWVENGERIPPRLSMIKGSGTIEEVSAQVLLLSETRVHLDQTEITGVVDKNRWGDKGMLTFALRKNPYRMVEI